MKLFKFPVKLNIAFLISLFIISDSSNAQDTFSICAVDLLTGQVGSAGATCIANSNVSAIIISDVHPGVGVVHTQASYQAMNQIRARTYMNLGMSPQEIIDTLFLNDWGSNPLIRQYGIVSLDSGGLSAAYTGINCSNYKNHITGPTYSIQGNILLGQQILDSMESRFLNTNGNLACKLMAALQGAKVIGADTRCASYGISSYSAFIRVANPGDSLNNLFLDLTVNTFPGNKEPVDSLQTLFDNWGGCTATFISSSDVKPAIKIFPNPVTSFLSIISNDEIMNVEILNSQSMSLSTINLNNTIESKIYLGDIPNGIYFIKVRFSNGYFSSFKILKQNP